VAETPANAGLLRFRAGLQAPHSDACEANSRKVSRLNREYSRFQETDAGDWVRSPMRGGGADLVGGTSPTTSGYVPMIMERSQRKTIGKMLPTVPHIGLIIGRNAGHRTVADMNLDQLKRDVGYRVKIVPPAYHLDVLGSPRSAQAPTLTPRLAPSSGRASLFCSHVADRLKNEPTCNVAPTICMHA
jgi:hypothetical protein